MAGKNRHFGDAETLTITSGRVCLGNESGVAEGKLDLIRGHRNDETVGNSVTRVFASCAGTQWAYLTLLL